MAKNRVEKMKDQLSDCLESALHKLQGIWDTIGIPAEQRQERANVVLLHLRNLMEEMVAEEEGLKTRLLNNVDKYGAELLRLTQEMSLAPHQPAEGLTILQLEKDLRTRVDSLSKEKQERLKQLKKLKETDQHLCDALCTTPYYIPTGSVPSHDQLQALEEHIASLQKEKERRATQFKQTRQGIQRLLEELDQGPNTSFEREIICEEEDSFLLSTENMKALKALYEELEQKSKDNFSLAGTLRDQVTTLWERLQIPEEERMEFTTKYTGFKPRTITALKAEIRRCEKLKLQNMKKVIEGARKELLDWWDKCFYSKEQRLMFKPYYDEEFTEELLVEHDQEVQRLKSKYERHKELYENVERREKLWVDYLAFEKRATDPNRFNNRGCNLLKEEKARKKLMKELPKVEADVAEQIKEWETENSEEFRINGMQYADYIANCWEDFKMAKENEKLQRHQNKAKMMEEELMFGSKPTTPAKRRFLGTPAKTPTKHRKLNETTKTPTSAHRSVRTPNHTSVFMSPACMPPRSASKRPWGWTPRALRPTQQRKDRKALTEKSANSNDTMFSHTTVSQNKGTTINSVSISSVGPYHEFANGLNQNARSNCRSSVLPGHNKVLNV